MARSSASSRTICSAARKAIADAGLSVARLIPNKWMLSRSDGPGLPRRFSGCLHVAPAAGSQLRRPSARLSGHQRIDQHRHRRVRTRTVTIRQARSSTIRIPASSRRRSSALTRPCGGGRSGDRSIARSSARSELVWSQREQPDGRQDGVGFFVSGRLSVCPPLVRRRAPRSVRPAPTRQDLRDKGGSVFLTYWPSEFSQVRGQYRRTAYARRPDGERVPVPVPVLDWAHGAHPF